MAHHNDETNIAIRRGYGVHLAWGQLSHINHHHGKLITSTCLMYSAILTER